MNTVDKVIDIALSQVGYLEKSRSAYQADKNVLYKFTEGAGGDNYTKFGKEMHDIYPKVMDFPAPWCDCFVDWCFFQATGIANAKGLLCGDFDDYTVGSAQLYKNKKAYYKSNPKVGDQIFFNNGTRICHTGLVYKVDKERVYTVEGNTNAGNSLVANGGGVAKKSYLLNYERIDGYGRPLYDLYIEDGWMEKDGNWYYYANNELVKGKWYEVNGVWYMFDADGKMKSKEWVLYKDEWYYLKADGSMACDEWLLTSGKLYRFDEKGRMMKTPIELVATDNGDYVILGETPSESR